MKFSIYLNRRVFVMYLRCHIITCTFTRTNDHTIYFIYHKQLSSLLFPFYKFYKVKSKFIKNTKMFSVFQCNVSFLVSLFGTEYIRPTATTLGEPDN